MVCASCLLWALIVTGTGCVSKDLEHQLDSQRIALVEETRELSRINQSGKTASLDWKTAVRLLSERNLTLRQSRSRIAQLKKEKDGQWKTWLPQLGMQANLLAPLSKLGALSTADLNATIIAPLNIPNPISERAKAYGYALSYLESQDSYELDYRRQVVTLYRMFSRYELQTARLISEDPSRAGRTSVDNALRNLESRSNQQDTLLSIQGGLAQFLNLPGQLLVPIPSTRPVLNYQDRLHTLVPGKNYGQLAVRLSAYQIEGALLREKGIKLNRWPSFNVSGSAPSLYDSQRSGMNGYFDAEQIYLFGSLAKAYDVTGRETDNVNTAKENTEFVKANLRLRLDQESREWLRLKERYVQIQLKQKLARQRLEAIRDASRKNSASLDLAALREQEGNLAMLDQMKEQLELEVWVWDDQKWK